MNNYEDILKGKIVKDKKALQSKAFDKFNAIITLNKSVYSKFQGIQNQIDELLNEELSEGMIEEYKSLFPQYFAELKQLRTDLNLLSGNAISPKWKPLIEAHCDFITHKMSLTEVGEAILKLSELLSKNEEENQLTNFDLIGEDKNINGRVVNLVRKNNKYGVISKDGLLLIEIMFDEMEIKNSYILGKIIIEGKAKECVFLNSLGKVIFNIRAQYDLRYFKYNERDCYQEYGSSMRFFVVVHNNDKIKIEETDNIYDIR